MVTSATITIRRQVLDVEVHGTQADGLALQRRLPAICADVLAPVLETELARIDPGRAHLCVERLEINVAAIALDRLERDLGEAVRKALADYVRRHPPEPLEPLDAGADPTHRSNPVEVRTAVERIDDAVADFLRTGQLPWSFRLPLGTKLEQVVVDAWTPNSADGTLRPGSPARLADVLTYDVARTRLLLQFTPVFVGRLLRAMSPHTADAVDAVLAALTESQVSGSATASGFARPVWDAALTEAAEVVLGLTPSGTTAAVRDRSAAVVRRAWQGLSSTERDDVDLAVLLETRWPGSTGAHHAPTSKEPATPGQPSGRASERASTQPSPRAPVGGSEGILVDDAGLVLLHPFLPRLFEALCVADGADLVDPVRALSLLHYLATGEPTAAEHQLTLSKALCEMPLERPVPAGVELTAAELAEADALLESVVHHWEALRGSSPEALRFEFLMRPGSLETDVDGGWLIRVESRTADILLDQLPWGISMFQLPWMSHLSRVDWR